MAFYNAIDLDNWKFRKATLTAPQTYKWLDKKWRTIKLGEDWGGNQVTGFFEREIVLPKEFAGQEVLLDIFLDGGEALGDHQLGDHLVRRVAVEVAHRAHVGVDEPLHGVGVLPDELRCHQD